MVLFARDCTIMAVYYKGALPRLLKNDKVVELPKIDNYLPTNNGLLDIY